MSIRVVAPALALCVLLALPAVAGAQAGSVDAGIKGGVNFATITTENATTLDFTYLRGWTGGVFVGRDFTDRVGLQVEGLYSQRGTKARVSGIDLEARLDYIDVPVLARFGGSRANGSRVHVLTGPTLSLKVDSSAKVGSMALDIGDNAKSVDVGWTVGAGVEVHRFVADARYTFGLVNVDKSGDDTVKNRTISLMVGFRLK